LASLASIIELSLSALSNSREGKAVASVTNSRECLVILRGLRDIDGDPVDQQLDHVALIQLRFTNDVPGECSRIDTTKRGAKCYGLTGEWHVLFGKRWYHVRQLRGLPQQLAAW
jgi:hypothetical protein